MSKRKLFIAILIGLVSVGLGTSVWAYLVIAAAASPQITSSSVGAPTSPSVLLYNNTAILSWTVPTSPSGATFTYTVARGASQGSVSGSCSGTVSGATCTDTGLTAGTSYSWTISSTITSTNWTSAATASLGPVTAVGPLTTFVWSGTPTGNVTAGSTVSGTVIAEDGSNRTETGYTGTITFSSTDAQAVFPSPNSYIFTSTDAGLHAFSNAFTLKTAGGQTLTATDSTLNESGTSASIPVVAAAASQIVAIFGSGQTTAPSTAFTNPIVAEVEDQYGNGVPGQTVTFQGPASCASVTFTTGIGTTCASFGTVGATSCTANTAANGQASSLTMKANGATGNNYTVTAKSGGFTVNFTETNGTFAFVVIPSTTTPTAGSGFTVSIQAQSNGSSDASYTGKQCLTFSGPANSPNTTTPTYPGVGSSPTCSSGQSQVTFSSGLASSVPITLVDAQQGLSLAVTDGTRTGAASLTVYSASVLSFGTCPSTMTKNKNYGGTAITRPATPDSYGNGTATGALTVALGASDTIGTAFWTSDDPASHKGTSVITSTTIAAGATASVTVYPTAPNTTGSATFTASGWPYLTTTCGPISH